MDNTFDSSYCLTRVQYKNLAYLGKNFDFEEKTSTTKGFLSLKRENYNQEPFIFDHRGQHLKIRVDTAIKCFNYGVSIANSHYFIP